MKNTRETFGNCPECDSPFPEFEMEHYGFSVGAYCSNFHCNTQKKHEPYKIIPLKDLIAPCPNCESVKIEMMLIGTKSDEVNFLECRDCGTRSDINDTLDRGIDHWNGDVLYYIPRQRRGQY